MKQYLRSAILILLVGVLAALTLTSCGKCKHEHTDWRVDVEPTCLYAGTRTEVCEDCGEELQTEQYAGNHYFEDGTCAYCKVAQYGTQYMRYRAITLNGEEGYEVVDMENCTEYYLTIPAIHNNKPVLAIAAGAFEKRLNLKSVHISQNVAVIGEGAFAGCTALEAVTFAEESELVSFGNGVFRDCELIKSIAIPAGVTVLSDGLFEGCTALCEVTVHNNLLSIGDDVFAECAVTPTLVEDGVAYLGTAEKPRLILLELQDKSRTAFEIPEGVVIIAPYALSSTAVQTVTFPSTLREIGGFAFSACTSLNNPTFPSSLVRIGKFAFAECTSLTDVALPNGFLDLGTGAFRRALALSSISIPDSILHVGASAFLECASEIYLTENGVSYVGNAQNPYLVLVKADRSLAEVAVNAQTRVIANGAFSGGSITSIEIPTGVVAIGNTAFSSCISLTAVVFAQTSGWQYANYYGASAQTVDVSDPAANAVSMTGAYRDAYYFRTEN